MDNFIIPKIILIDNEQFYNPKNNFDSFVSNNIMDKFTIPKNNFDSSVRNNKMDNFIIPKIILIVL